ncbi:MAG: aminopeptidase [Granulosicoccus sp.]|nr:aminopeptidase [Granulosicoccus sp.]
MRLTKLLRHRAFYLLLCVFFLQGCSTISYYAQAVNGHFKLMNARQPVAQLLASDDTDAELRRKLQLLIDARQYAASSLSLPKNDSYSTYVDAGRDYVTWNVVAAPEFSLKPKTWCFPIAGCVSYRGYFAEARARAYADTLKAESYDVTVGGASAYSTLGWFDDPLLSTMMRGSDIRLVSTLFHERAHQKLYVQDDSNFNEAYASFVEQAGVRRWLADQGKAETIPAYDAYLSRQLDFGELLRQTRGELVNLYKKSLPVADMRAAKAEIFATLRKRYAALKNERWQGYSGYDNWFNKDINNARLLAVATYRKWVPAFAELYRQQQEDFDRFYQAAEALGKLPIKERRMRLQGLIDQADT